MKEEEKDATGEFKKPAFSMNNSLNSISKTELKTTVMKTSGFKNTIIGGILFLLLSTGSHAQIHYLGHWEGLFMNDFKTILELNFNENNDLSGSIQMYSGKTLIQNDPLSKITLTDNQLTFYIESKQTEFTCEFNTKVSELKGEFIFPDRSKHPITLSKNYLKKSKLLNGSKASYSTLKTRKFTVNEQKEDLNFLVEKLEELHPKLYAYTSKEEYEELISESLQNIDTEVTLVDFFKSIAPVVERVKCSHTGIQLPQDFKEGIISHGNFLPLKLRFEGEKVFCLNNICSMTGIVPGSEILTINNIPVQDIKQILHKFIPSEGNNKTTKDYYLNQNFNYWFNLMDNSPVFEVGYKKNNSNHLASLKACKYSELGHNQDKAENEKPFCFFLDKKKGVGFLTVRSFMCPDINKYIQEMDTIFSALLNESSSQLVLDLRGNSGGHPIFAAQLLSYLTNKEFTYFKRNDDIEEFEPLYNQMSPNELQFRGDIYVFIDGGCLSTTGHLISLIKFYTDAIFFGEEPGSTYQCNDFSVKEILPNTGIEVNIPKTTFETAIDKPDKMTPFVVDYQVRFSIEDYFKGVDSYINFLYGLVF